MTHTGIAYPLVSFVAVFPLVAVVAMLFSGVFDILKSGDTADTIAATRPNEWSLGHDTPRRRRASPPCWR
jgi:hypothetical protein